jgi:hypothetical protein
MNIKDLDKDWGDEFRLKFSQIVTRIINLNVIPNIQSQINERIPPQRGFSIYDEQNELVNFIKNLLSQSNQEILDRVDKELIGYIESERFGDEFSFIRGKAIGRNELRWEQRQKLTQLRQSNNLLGEKK